MGLLTAVATCLLVALALSVLAWRRRASSLLRCTPFTVGFFHPFAASGGGGERVLWQYVRALHAADPSVRILIYTGDAEAGDAILRGAQDRFNIPVAAVPVEFIRVRCRRLVTAEMWPRFTMFGQSLGSVILAMEALLIAPCHLFIDTTGFAFSYPAARLLTPACEVHTYTHYPTISSDMLALVFARRESYNNSAAVAGSPLRARAKWVYYKIFAWCYARAGRCAQSVFANSTWTRDHINAVWQSPSRTRIVFPPCDTAGLRAIPLDSARERLVVSLGQFRPEKDHALQIRSFALFLQKMRERDPTAAPVRLVLIGGARDEGDRARVASLRQLALSLDLGDSVEFLVNVPGGDLRRTLARAAAGLHTMWNEHFGIGVVEFMAAGVLAVAHNSGGPRSDILAVQAGEQRVGFLASNEEEYASALLEIFSSSADQASGLEAMRRAARERAEAFSDAVFIEQLEKHLMPIVRARKEKCKLQH